LGIRGLSVTIPHKEEILNHKTKCDPGTVEIGAANTLVWEGEDRIAWNTDYRAVKSGLDEVYGEGEQDALTMKDKHALVLGAGGVARAVVLALARRGKSMRCWIVITMPKPMR
jgi:3-dehydroquinate dehydratase/shikimate dehydrogenase